jgi:hypothetical protein
MTSHKEISHRERIVQLNRTQLYIVTRCFPPSCSSDRKEYNTKQVEFVFLSKELGYNITYTIQ